MIKILHWRSIDNQAYAEVSDLSLNSPGLLENTELPDVEPQVAEIQDAEIVGTYTPSSDSLLLDSVNEGLKLSEYQVRMDNHTLEVTFNVKQKLTPNVGMISGEFSIDTEDREKVWDIFLRESDIFGAVEIVEAYAYCNHNNATTNAFDRDKIARVIVDDLGDVYVVLIKECLDIPGFDNVIMTPDNPASRYLKQECPWFANVHRRMSVKYGLIKNLDEYRSLSYLEAQVDVLTKIVLSLIDEKHEYYGLLLQADNSSVLNIKPIDAVEAEFLQNKHDVRIKQEGYYNVLHG